MIRDCLCWVILGLSATGNSSAESAADGAQVPFTTYEAEAASNKTTGTVVRITNPPAPGEITPELEASGRGYVALTAEGQYLEFPNVEEANTIVIRHCIPDAPTGGGETATLGLYVNGERRQALKLSSFHNWLYGRPHQNGQSNNPSVGQPHDFWDESRYIIEGGVRKGDTIKLQKDSKDTASYYRIDLIDLENAPPPLPPPPAGSYLSVSAFGAKGDGKNDDTAPIARCIDAAAMEKKKVWIPPGTYLQSEQFKLDGVIVQGAGMWHTNLVGTAIGTTFGGNVGFKLMGEGSAVRDLAIDSAVHSTRGDKGGKPFTGNPANWAVENVWITHTNVGFWMSGASNGVIRGCRVRCTYADGINLNRGASNNLIENCSVRGTGDDGTAILADARDAIISSNNIVRHNTVTAVWWGANCDIAGGSGQIVEHNYWADNTSKECFTINLPASYPMHPQTGALISHNTIVRGGGYWGQRRGAMWIYAGSVPISNVSIVDNQILDPVSSGIHLAGNYQQQISVSHNTITNPGTDGIYIESTVQGTGAMSENTITGLKAGCVAVKNASKDFILTK